MALATLRGVLVAMGLPFRMWNFRIRQSDPISPAYHSCRIRPRLANHGANMPGSSVDRPAKQHHPDQPIFHEKTGLILGERHFFKPPQWRFEPVCGWNTKVLAVISKESYKSTANTQCVFRQCPATEYMGTVLAACKGDPALRGPWTPIG